MAQDKFDNYMIAISDVGDDCGEIIRIFNIPTFKKARKKARKIIRKYGGGYSELFEYNGDTNKPFDPVNVGELLWDNSPEDGLL